MALKCEFCGKGPAYGNKISHANNVRRRRWNPNLRRVHALVGGVFDDVKILFKRLDAQQAIVARRLFLRGNREPGVIGIEFSNHLPHHRR